MSYSRAMDREYMAMVEHARRNAVEISPDEAKSRLNAPQKQVLLDVREPGEWAAARIPDSVHIPLSRVSGMSMDSAVQAGLPEEPGAPVIVYCGHGVRSLLAAETLKQLGYEQVCSLAGGIVEWSRRGLAIETGRQGSAT